MSRINFDNIMKILRLETLLVGSTLVSTPMDFDIPRGFIVKIHDVVMEFINIGEDFETISVDKYARVSAALVKDPDDLTTLSIPNATVDHDVVIDIAMDIMIVAGTAGDTSFMVLNHRKEANFSAEGLDVFTARNMRVNFDAFGTDATDLTETKLRTTVKYTLEEITDKLIINLLDIL